jgi:hypothetical protein
MYTPVNDPDGSQQTVQMLQQSNVHASAHGAAVPSSSAHTVPAQLDQAALQAFIQQQVQAGIAHIMQQQQQQQQQATASSQLQAFQSTAVQLLQLQSLGSLRPFSGKGDVDGLAARDWITQTEHHFAAKEQALNVSAQQADATRVSAARTALEGDAQRWHTALPQPPTTWAAFRTAFLARFSSVPAVQVRERRLEAFVEGLRKSRASLNLPGIQAFSTKFLQLAGEIPTDRISLASRYALYASCLPPRYAEFVLQKDAEANPPPMHELVQLVLSKAAMKSYAGGSFGASSSSAAAAKEDSMEIDAISLAAMQFGVSREEAASYFTPAEGWMPHDTNKGFGGEDPTVERVLAALGSRFGANLKAGTSVGRRGVPSAVKKEIPEPLASERRTAGLCIKCGVVQYSPGGKGHNSVTCKAPADKSTPVAVGKRKAGLGQMSDF